MIDEIQQFSAIFIMIQDLRLKSPDNFGLMGLQNGVPVPCQRCAFPLSFISMKICGNQIESLYRKKQIIVAKQISRSR